MLFLNKDDVLRKEFDISRKPADAMVRKGHEFSIPMPALGESIVKIREKHPESFDDVMKELDRLLTTGFFTVSYIRTSDTFHWANRLSSETKDSRDEISPMDALITGSAIVDERCGILYTVDTKLLMDLDSLDDANEWRRKRGMCELRIRSIFEVIGSRR